jgi:ABC-type glycerol-3-phosphate transport system permease component
VYGFHHRRAVFPAAAVRDAGDVGEADGRNPPGTLFALPLHPRWSHGCRRASACTGLECNGIAGGFWNSVAIVVPSTILSIAIGAVNGYALSFWRPRGAGCCLPS